MRITGTHIAYLGACHKKVWLFANGIEMKLTSETGGGVKARKGQTERALKRRSPLPISIMRALHPLFAGLGSNGGEKRASVPRTERPHNIVNARDTKGQILNREEVREILSEEDSREADPVIDESLTGVETYISLQAGGYILTKGETADALERAEQALVDKMLAFDYENQA